MQLSKTQYRKARDFILTNARMIERRLFHYHFEQGDASGVFHAVYAYRNPDGVLFRSSQKVLKKQKVDQSHK